jgi:hypothetical protein
MTTRLLDDQLTNETNWAEFDSLWPYYSQSVQVIAPRGDLKRKALACLDEHEYKNGWNKHAQRRYVVKRHKLRTSSKKTSRSMDNQLTERVNWYLHFSH